MSNAVNNLFSVLRAINKSNEPMTVEQISEKTWLGTATVRHYANRLVKENLIDVNTSGRGGRLHYMIKGLRV